MIANSFPTITPTAIASSYRILSSPLGIPIQQNGRKHWGILLKAAGKTVYEQQGCRYVCDSHHAVLLPKDGKYIWTCEEPGECIVIDFDAPQSGCNILSMELTNTDFIISAFSKIEKAITSGTTIDHLDAMHQLYGILLQLCKIADKRYIPKTQQTLLAPAISYMAENYATGQISNDSLAALCGISTVYFRKNFEAVYGISPIRYLHRLQILKAKAMLSGDYNSISQVADSVGYNSVHHFSKMFRIYTGMSPREYARSIANSK